MNFYSGGSVDYQIKHAIDIIHNDYGDVVSVDAKKKDLTKWGENEAVGTSLTTLMTFPAGISNEVMLSDNLITHVVSSSASDTQNIRLHEGHTISGPDLTFFKTTTNLELNGQTPVALPTPLARMNRARIETAANGNISFYRGGTVTNGVPDNAAQVHLIIPQGEVQTQKCATSISSSDYWILTGMTVSVLEKTASWAQARIEVLPVGSTDEWYPTTQWVGASDTAGTVSRDFKNYKIVPKNHDVRLVAKANTSGVYVAGGIVGYLASVLT